MDPQHVFGAEVARREAAKRQAADAAIDRIDVASRDLFETDTVLPYFERLRREAPVHFCPESEDGAYWSVTRFDDIKAMELDWEHFSSEPQITLPDVSEGGAEEPPPMFIAMDPPRHTHHRKAVRPSVAPKQARNLEPLVRERTATILDSLPVGETFDWVERVSIELTTQMLATLFGFPFEDRAKLTRWSDVSTALPGDGVIESWEQRTAELTECLAYFLDLWHERANSEPSFDILSMLAHAPDTADMHERPYELLGNMMLLIVGGNDTTRNSMTGGVVAFNEYPEEWGKLMANRDLVPNMVNEVIRWQTPLAHMRRTVTKDVEFGGKQMKAGEKVALWYLSANRDESVFEDGDRFRIDRPNANDQLAFGTGIHYCIGAHLGRMQLQVLWEEVLERFSRIEVVEAPTRVRSNFVRGYTHLPVRLHTH